MWPLYILLGMMIVTAIGFLIISIIDNKYLYEGMFARLKWKRELRKRKKYE